MDVAILKMSALSYHRGQMSQHKALAVSQLTEKQQVASESGLDLVLGEAVDPFCAGNDLKQIYPALASQWNCVILADKRLHPLQVGENAALS